MTIDEFLKHYDISSEPELGKLIGKSRGLINRRKHAGWTLRYRVIDGKKTIVWTRPDGVNEYEE